MSRGETPGRAASAAGHPAERALARVLIVDDEPPARRRLRRLLANRDDVELVGESTHGREAVAAITELVPDVVFLDVRMPDLDGIGVLEEIGPERMPVVVFVTAFDEYALDAFELAALDYLLKPYTDERFELALERSLERLREQRSEALCERLTCLIDSHHHRSTERPASAASSPVASAAPPSAPWARRIAVQKHERTFFVPVAEIDWIEAEGAYVRLHVVGRSHLIRDSLKNLERRLDPERFLRVHRSSIVRVDRVVEMAPLFHGEYQLVLKGGERLKLSRSYRHQLERLREG